jgi:hypothetical protein
MKGSERERLPNRRASIAYCFNFEGHNYLATSSNFDDGRLAEIFLDAGKVGSAVQYHASTGAILASLLLQHGVDVETVRHSVHGPIGVALDYFSKPPALIKGGR